MVSRRPPELPEIVDRADPPVDLDVSRPRQYLFDVFVPGALGKALRDYYVEPLNGIITGTPGVDIRLKVSMAVVPTSDDFERISRALDHFTKHSPDFMKLLKALDFKPVPSRLRRQLIDLFELPHAEFVDKIDEFVNMLTAMLESDGENLRGLERPIDLVRDALESGAEVNVEELARQIAAPRLEDEGNETEQRRKVISLLSQAAIRNSYIDALRDQRDADVAAARALGATWAEVAETFGVTPSTAMRRWDPQQKANHRDYQRRLRNGQTTSASTNDDT